MSTTLWFYCFDMLGFLIFIKTLILPSKALILPSIYQSCSPHSTPRYYTCHVLRVFCLETSVPYHPEYGAMGASQSTWFVAYISHSKPWRGFIAPPLHDTQQLSRVQSFLPEYSKRIYFIVDHKLLIPSKTCCHLEGKVYWFIKFNF